MALLPGATRGVSVKLAGTLQEAAIQKRKCARVLGDPAFLAKIAFVSFPCTSYGKLSLLRIPWQGASEGN